MENIDTKTALNKTARGTLNYGKRNSHTKIYKNMKFQSIFLAFTFTFYSAKNDTECSYLKTLTMFLSY